MKKYFLGFLFLFFWSVAPAQVRSAEQQVKDLSERKFSWLVNKTYDSLSGLLDEKLQYVHSNGWIQNRDEVIGDLKSGKLDYVSVTVKESQVRLYGTTAIVNGLGTFQGVTTSGAFTMDLRYTEVYIKSGIHWKLVSRHANRMP